MVETNSSKRFSADNLKAISKDAVHKKRVQTTINKHRAAIWAQLIARASKGAFAAELPNLSDQDVAFLRETGLYVAEKFIRKKQRSLIASEIEALKAEYKSLALPKSKSGNQPETPIDRMNLISRITAKNQGLSYMSGLDEWFGDDFTGLYLETKDEAQSFLAHLESTYTRSNDREKRDFLNELIPHARKVLALIDQEQDAEEILDANLDSLGDRIQVLEESDDFSHEESVNSLHEIDWGCCDRWNPIDGVNSYDLFWLSSREGQNFLSEVEGKIVGTAGKGSSKIAFSALEAQAFKHVNDVERFTPYKYKADGLPLVHFGPNPHLFATAIEQGGTKVEVDANRDGGYTIKVKW